MKKLVAMILALTTCITSYALPLGNPSEASLFMNGIWWSDCSNNDPCDPCFSWCDAWSFRLGFYGDYVYNHHMHIEDPRGRHGKLHNFEMHTNAAYFAVNFCDRFDVFGTVGATNLKAEFGTNFFRQIIVPLEGRASVEFPSSFSWSVGARATLWECECFAIGAEGQYFQVRPHGGVFDDGLPGIVSHIDRRSRYHEWQGGIGASYRIATSCPTLAFVPYTGIKWSGSRHDLPDFTFTSADTFILYRVQDFKSDRHWGYCLGTSFTMCDLIGFTVEGRWGDEKAFYVNGQVRF